jgi:hypothetical protein
MSVPITISHRNGNIIFYFEQLSSDTLVHAKYQAPKSPRVVKRHLYAAGCVVRCKITKSKEKRYFSYSVEPEKRLKIIPFNYG